MTGLSGNVSAKVFEKTRKRSVSLHILKVLLLYKFTAVVLWVSMLSKHGRTVIESCKVRCECMSKTV